MTREVFDNNTKSYILPKNLKVRDLAREIVSRTDLTDTPINSAVLLEQNGYDIGVPRYTDDKGVYAPVNWYIKENWMAFQRPGLMSECILKFMKYFSKTKVFEKADDGGYKVMNGIRKMGTETSFVDPTMRIEHEWAYKAYMNIAGDIVAKPRGAIIQDGKLNEIDVTTTIGENLPMRSSRITRLEYAPIRKMDQHIKKNVDENASVSEYLRGFIKVMFEKLGVSSTFFEFEKKMFGRYSQNVKGYLARVLYPYVACETAWGKHSILKITEIDFLKYKPTPNMFFPSLVTCEGFTYPGFADVFLKDVEKITRKIYREYRLTIDPSLRYASKQDEFIEDRIVDNYISKFKECKRAREYIIDNNWVAFAGGQSATIGDVVKSILLNFNLNGVQVPQELPMTIVSKYGDKSEEVRNAVSFIQRAQANAELIRQNLPKRPESS
jgi:hypothetical protein